MEELDFKTIGYNIRNRRKALKITQEHIANLLDVNPSHISNIECGRANPSLTVLIKIANILQCSVDCFINQEYTYIAEEQKSETIDEKIIKKLEFCDAEKKYKILKIIDFL